MKLLHMVWLTLLVSVSYASENEENDQPVTKDPLDFVLVCPEHSVHKGDKVPEWATTIDAITFFCNDTQETEIAE